MKKRRLRDKFYTHFDLKKRYVNYESKVKNPDFITSHGFFPFIHFQMVHNKFKLNIETGIKEIMPKTRDIKYAAHIDRYIYQYYGEKINLYSKAARKDGINKVATAYRNNFPGRSNIHFAKEVFEFIAEQENAYIFLGDFSNFFDKLDHSYLRDRLKTVLNVNSLPEDHYAVFKNVTKYTYMLLTDIANYKNITMKKIRDSKQDKFLSTKDLQLAKKRYLKKNEKSYGIPQGSSISSVYSNVYMMEFDKVINAYVTARKGLYRRYCDDFIIVIAGEDNSYSDFIFQQTKAIPNLDLQPEKTEQFLFNRQNEKRLVSIDKKKHHINYLGFYFDGKMVKIRDKSLFKYYSRAYKKANSVKWTVDKKRQKEILRRLFDLYTYIGDKEYDSKGRKYGNFLTYARKAHKEFTDSQLIESEINKQVRRHWKKISDIVKKGKGNPD